MHIVIIGNGISGVSVAKSLREYSDAEITIVSSESMSFFSRPAFMYVFMGKMRFTDILPFPSDYWVKNKMKQLYGAVKEIDAENKQVCLDNGSVLPYDKLVLALGSQPKSLGLGEFNLEGIQGFYSLQDLEKLQDSSKKLNMRLSSAVDLLAWNWQKCLFRAEFPLLFGLEKSGLDLIFFLKRRLKW